MASKTRCVEIVPANAGFELVENGVSSQELVFNKKHDRINGKKMKKKDSYLIEFRLDEDGDYKFEQNRTRVMLVDESSCPYPTNDPEFEIEELEDYILVVRNRDRGEQRYKFALMLVDASGSQVPYDPIYDNRNGGLVS